MRDDPRTDKENHLFKAESNDRFLNSFDLYSGDFLDWAVVVIFYTALHYVDAYLATRGYVEITGGHRGRNLLVSQHLEPIESAYMNLYWAGRNARYIPDYKPSLGKVITYKRHSLQEIKRYVLSILK